MPLYEYRCRQCDNRFERIEKASAPSDGVCPECGGAARRLLGAPALQFKGSGWYVNDYGKGRSAPTASAADGTGASTAGPASDTAGESPASSAGEGSSKSDTTATGETKVA